MDEITAIIDQGTLRGKIEIDIRGSYYNSFYNIPYAKPPIGQLRFKDPQPPEAWEGIRDATLEGSPCYSCQITPTAQGLEIADSGSEDCLTLTVFTHKASSNQDLKPVMFWIHGGGFITGNSLVSTTGPHLLMTQDIVLVTVHYRLGALGFLDIENSGVANAGFKDLVQALKWVKINIAQFGGDPHCVTIFGESAGSAAVHYLVLSPLTKGLFHRAIAQSGVAINCWAKGQRNNGIKLAEVLGFYSTTPVRLLQYLQQLPKEKILEGQRKLGDFFDVTRVRYFCPTVEEASPTAFISEDPIKIMTSGNYNHVPFMIGYNSLEGLIFPIMPKIGLEMVLTKTVPLFLNYEENGEEYNATARKINKYFYGSEKDDPKNVLALTNLSSDIFLTRGINSSAKLHAKTSSQPVYFYEMTIETKLNYVKRMMQDDSIKDVPGAVHAEDLGYLFTGAGTADPEPGSPEDVGSRRFLKLWTNFARTGNPTPEEDPLLGCTWKPATGTELNFLEIGSELVPGTDPDKERMEFWDEIFKSAPPY